MLTRCPASSTGTTKRLSATCKFFRACNIIPVDEESKCDSSFTLSPPTRDMYVTYFDDIYICVCIRSRRELAAGDPDTLSTRDSAVNPQTVREQSVIPHVSRT